MSGTNVHFRILLVYYILVLFVAVQTTTNNTRRVNDDDDNNNNINVRGNMFVESLVVFRSTSLVVTARRIQKQQFGLLSRKQHRQQQQHSPIVFYNNDPRQCLELMDNNNNNTNVGSCRDGRSRRRFDNYQQQQQQQLYAPSLLLLTNNIHRNGSTTIDDIIEGTNLLSDPQRPELGRRAFLDATMLVSGLVLALPTKYDVAQAASITKIHSIDIESNNDGRTLIATDVITQPSQYDPVSDPKEESSSSFSSSSLLSTSILSSTAAAAASSSTGSSGSSVDWNAIVQKASKKAVGGGQAGALAAIVQVFSLMWLRTSMNYQYRYGGTLQSSLSTLYNEGGVVRLYQGLPFALVQGPLTRFGDTAANIGILALLETIPVTQNLPLPIKTACGSITAGLWRIVLMPIDTSKTALQVEGGDALRILWQNVQTNGPGVLYRGAIAQAAATAVGHFPWFLTYNFLDSQLPTTVPLDGMNIVFWNICRSALLGLSASCVSDCTSNSLRVIKTTKQTAALSSSTTTTTTTPARSVSTDTTTTPPLTTKVIDDGTTSNIVVDTTTGSTVIMTTSTTTTPKSNGTPTSSTTTSSTTIANDLSYREIVTMIIEQDGIIGLFGRGLQTRLLTNAIQGAVFSVLWKYFQQMNA